MLEINLNEFIPEVHRNFEKEFTELLRKCGVVYKDATFDIKINAGTFLAGQIDFTEYFMVNRKMSIDTRPIENELPAVEVEYPTTLKEIDLFYKDLYSLLRKYNIKASPYNMTTACIKPKFLSWTIKEYSKDGKSKTVTYFYQRRYRTHFNIEKRKLGSKYLNLPKH